MKEIMVLSGSKRGFTVSFGDDKYRLEYPGWLSQKANIIIVGELYTVEQKGFFGSSSEIKKEGRTLLRLKMDWKGNTTIAGLVENSRHWLFKHHGFFTSRFTVTDEQGSELLQVYSAYQWSNFTWIIRFQQVKRLVMKAMTCC